MENGILYQRLDEKLGKLFIFRILPALKDQIKSAAVAKFQDLPVFPQGVKLFRTVTISLGLESMLRRSCIKEPSISAASRFRFISTMHLMEKAYYT